MQTSEPVNCVVFDDVNNQIIGGVGNQIQVWDSQTGKLRQTFEKGHIANIFQIIVCGDYLVSCSSDAWKNLLLWDRNEGKVIQQFIGHENGMISFFLFLFLFFTFP